MPTDIVKLRDSNNELHEFNSKITRGIVRATLDSSSTSTNFIATAPGVTELYDGLTIFINNTVVSSAAGNTIDLNNLGAKSVHISKTSGVMNTAFEKGSIYLFIFDYANDYWVLQTGYYGTDTDTIGEYGGALVIDNNGYCFDNGIVMQTQLNPPRWSAITTTGGTGTNKTKCALGFIPNGKLLCSTANVSAEGTLGRTNAWWLVYSINLRYWTNCSTSTLPSTAIGKALYIKCTMSNGLLYIADAPWWVTDLPSTSDGYYYIYVGQMYSRYQCTPAPEHPIYYHDGTQIREYHYEDEYLGSASGEVCSFTDGTNYEIKKGIVNITPMQTGEGTASPTNIRPIVGSSECDIFQTNKNLIIPDRCLPGYPNSSTGVMNWGITSNYDYATEIFKVKHSTSYTFSLDINNSSAKYYTYVWYDANMNLISAAATKLGTGTTYSSTIVTPTNCVYMRISWRNYSLGTDTIPQNKIQLEESTAKTNYIDNSYYIKNIELFEPVLEFEDYLNESHNGLTIEGVGNEIHFSGTPTASWANLTSDISVSIPAGTTISLKITEPIDVRPYIRIYNSSNEYIDILIEKGDLYAQKLLPWDGVRAKLILSLLSTSINYNNTIEICMYNSQVYGGYIDLDNKKLHITHKKYALTSSNFPSSLFSNKAARYRNTDFTNANWNTDNTNFMCESLQVVNPNTSSSNMPTYSIKNTVGNYYNVELIAGNTGNITTQDINDLFTALGGYLIIVAKLDTPLELDISDVPSIYTSNGVNTIYADTGSMSFEYIKNTKVMQTVDARLKEEIQPKVVRTEASYAERFLLDSSHDGLGEARVLFPNGNSEALLHVNSNTVGIRVGKALRKWTKFAEATGSTLSTANSINIPYGSYLDPTNLEAASEIMVKVEVQITPNYKVDKYWVIPVEQLLEDSIDPSQPMLQDNTILMDGYYYSSSYYGSYGVEYDRTSNFTVQGVTFKWSTDWAKIQGIGDVGEDSHAYRMTIYLR